MIHLWLYFHAFHAGLVDQWLSNYRMGSPWTLVAPGLAEVDGIALGEPPSEPGSPQLIQRCFRDHPRSGRAGEVENLPVTSVVDLPVTRMATHLPER